MPFALLNSVSNLLYIPNIQLLRHRNEGHITNEMLKLYDTGTLTQGVVLFDQNKSTKRTRD